MLRNLKMIRRLNHVVMHKVQYLNNCNSVYVLVDRNVATSEREEFRSTLIRIVRNANNYALLLSYALTHDYFDLENVDVVGRESDRK